MLLSRDDAALFVRLHSALMFFVNQRLGVIPNVADQETYIAFSAEERMKVHDALHSELDLIDLFAKQNPAGFSDDELSIVLSWRHQVRGKFYAFRQLKNYMVFLSSDESPLAFGVVAITQPFEELVGPHLPVLVRTTLMPFQDVVVYDGLLSAYRIQFGAGIRRSLNDTYREAKQRCGIVTSLPFDPARTSAIANKEQKPKRSGARDVKLILKAVVELTDQFCQNRLNDEYRELCRKLAEKLSRKRPSPLLRGKPKTWACGIIRAIGHVNFLDDSSTQPHLKLTAIDDALGVGASSGQGKSREIRKMFRMQPFDMDWTLPSQMDDNPLVWMLEVNGFMIDVRNAPREFQEIAFAKRLIPYIPADRETEPVTGDDDSKPSSTSDRLYQFKITLNDFKPAIWRRIQVQDCTLDNLHDHIQTAMGWTNSHLHQFEIRGDYYGDPGLLNDGDLACLDSTATMIHDILPQDGKRFRFRYEYDFGDGWNHEILFEGCPPIAAGQQYPLCVEGQNACPPEDVGGVCGYLEFLEALADPSHQRHHERMEWLDGPFDPAAFDADEATMMMRQGLPAWR